MSEILKKPRITIYASGKSDGGGSGCGAVVYAIQNGLLDAEVVAIVSNHINGGVRKIADDNNIPFYFFSAPSVNDYHLVSRETESDLFLLFGWLKKVKGLDPRYTVNVHPAPISFGGNGMYGDNLYCKLLSAFETGEITESANTMHFVTEEYDRGPVFFERPVEILPCDTIGSLETRTKVLEHVFVPHILCMLLQRQIYWDGIDPRSLVVPEGYRYLPEK